MEKGSLPLITLCIWKLNFSVTTQRVGLTKWPFLYFSLALRFYFRMNFSWEYFFCEIYD